MNDALAWERLGLDPTADETTIRRAYAAMVRKYRPDSHPLEFSQVREAYETALAHVRQARSAEPDESIEPAPIAADPAASRLDGADVCSATPPFNARECVETLHRCQVERGDEASRLVLHEQFEELAQRTVDAKVDYEGHLLHWLLSSETPPPAVVFEGARLFRWTDRYVDIAQMFGEGGAQRLGLLMEMANQYIFALHFSSNSWHKRLFDPRRSTPPWFGSLAHLQNARGVAGYWEQLCAAGRLPRSEHLLCSPVRSRLQGRVIASTDLLLSIVLGACIWLQVSLQKPSTTWWFSAGVSLLPALAFLPLPMMWRRFTDARLFKRIAAAKPTQPWHLLLGGVLLTLSFAMALIAADPGQAPMVRYAGMAAIWVFAGSLILVATVAVWYLVRYLELLGVRQWVHLQRLSDVQAFQKVLQERAPHWHGPTLAVRVRSLPAALKLGWAERSAARRASAQRKAESETRVKAEQALFGQQSTRSGFHWWWILVVIMALGRLIGSIPT